MITSQITWRREGDHEYVGGPIRRWLDRRRLEQADTDRASELVNRFYATVGGLGLGRDTSSCAGIPGFATPTVAHVVLGSTVERLTIRIMPGQLMSEYQDRAAAFAEGLGGASCIFRHRAHGLIIAELRRFDPLESPVDLPPLMTSRAGDILVGLLDNAESLTVTLRAMSHLLVQGQTRSGKSRWTYGFLSQVAGCSDVRVSGSDISGILLRPFIGTRHDELLALGGDDLERHAWVLEQLVAVMNDRLSRMPEDDDVYPTSVDEPYEVVLLEELPGLLKAAKNEDLLRKADKARTPLLARIQGAYGRLLAEGAKTGIRLVILMQRADATIIGGFERGQLPIRISFSVGDPGDVAMLHPTVDIEVAKAHTVAPAARALVSGPGIPLARLRAPEMGDYAQFRANVLSTQSPRLQVVTDAAA